jgi:hypothetical protein
MSDGCGSASNGCGVPELEGEREEEGVRTPGWQSRVPRLPDPPGGDCSIVFLLLGRATDSPAAGAAQGETRTEACVGGPRSTTLWHVAGAHCCRLHLALGWRRWR